MVQISVSPPAWLGGRCRAGRSGRGASCSWTTETHGARAGHTARRRGRAVKLGGPPIRSPHSGSRSFMALTQRPVGGAWAACGIGTPGSLRGHYVSRLFHGVGTWLVGCILSPSVRRTRGPCIQGRIQAKAGSRSCAIAPRMTSGPGAGRVDAVDSVAVLLAWQPRHVALCPS